MAATETASRIAPYIEQLLEDDTAQKNLRLGAEKLRDGVSELVHGAQKPKRRRGRRLLALLTLGGLAAGVALTFNDDLQASLLGSGKAPVEQSAEEGRA